MIRLTIFVLGIAMLYVGAASNVEFIPEVYDCKSIELGISLSVMTLDVLLIVLGSIFIVIAWVFHRLAQ